MKAHKTEHILVGKKGEFCTDAFDSNELYRVYWDIPEFIDIDIIDHNVFDLIVRPRYHPGSFDGFHTDKYPL